VTPRYRRRRTRRIPFVRRAWRWLAGAVAAALALLVVIVGLLRFVDPPVTAFMLHADREARRAQAPFALQHHWIDDRQIPAAARLAVIAAEDQRFATHRGFDMAEIANAIDDARLGRRVRGASTLSQQTAKNLFLWPGQSWVRKGLEAGLTALIELLWPKRRILEVYLNVAEFGPGLFGIEAAARQFFGKPAAALTAEECALLAAVLPSPRRFRADAPSDYVLERQQWILAQMHQVAGFDAVQQLVK
jgi:monofunctional glycosyltransferase